MGNKIPFTRAFGIAAVMGLLAITGLCSADDELPLLESFSHAKPKKIVINRPIQTQEQILGTRLAARATPVSRPDRPAAPVVTSCRKQDFVGLEKQARTGIEQAWKDTEAGRWGYGFRGKDEYRKWRAAHKTLFTETREACKQAVACSKRAGKTAQQACNDLAWQFAGWQETAREFSAKVAQMKSGQAPQLCSLSPKAGDLSECFDRLATRIDEDCSGRQCKEISSCWRSVAYLDEAIRQAESACGFAGQEPAQCRGWQDANSRRKQAFSRCETLHNKAGLTIRPVL